MEGVQRMCQCQRDRGANYAFQVEPGDHILLSTSGSLSQAMASNGVRKGPGAGSPSMQAPSALLKRSAKEARLAEPKPKRQRTKAGCITCRVRGKVSLLPWSW